MDFRKQHTLATMTKALRSERDSLNIIKVNDDLKTLQIDVQNYSTVAADVLRKKTKFERIEIGGFFDGNLDESQLFKKFWCTVGKMVIELVVDPGFYVKDNVSKKRFDAIFNNFVCLKRIKINSSYLHLLSHEFFSRNKTLEVIDIYSGDEGKSCIFEKGDKTRDSESLPENRGGRRWVTDLLGCLIFEGNDQKEQCESINYKDSRSFTQSEKVDWEILSGFKNICKYSTSLKKISFPCDLRFNYDILNEVFTYFSNTFLCVDELFIDYDTLFSYPNCSVSKIEIEIVDMKEKVDKIRRKAIVKFVEIEILMKPLKNENFRTEGRFCFFQHYNYTNSTVESVAVLLWHDNYNSISNVCHKCLESIIKSFANARCFLRNNYHYRNLHLSIIMRMSKLPHQTHLKLSYWKDLRMWPVFKQLKCLDIELDVNQSPVGIAHLCQCCPNLEKFIIKFNLDYIKRRHITIKEDTLVEIITKHLSKVKILEIEQEIKIGSKSLERICVNLKRLTKLKIGYDNDPRELLGLFKELPRLQLIEYSSKSLSRHDYEYLQRSIAPNNKIKNNQ